MSCMHIVAKYLFKKINLRWLLKARLHYWELQRKDSVWEVGREIFLWLQISCLSKPWINKCHMLAEHLRLHHGCQGTVSLVAVSTMTNSCIHYEYLQVFIKLTAAFWSIAPLQLCNMSPCSEAGNHICSFWAVKKARCEQTLWKPSSFQMVPNGGLVSAKLENAPVSYATVCFWQPVLLNALQNVIVVEAL